MTRRLLAPAPLISIALAAAGCGGGDGGGATAAARTLAPGDVIGMKQLRFRPDAVRVPVGQTVVWVNDESIPHDVKATSGAGFASKTFGKGGRFEWKADRPGTIRYVCTLHPGMDGTIEVVGK